MTPCCIYKSSTVCKEIHIIMNTGVIEMETHLKIGAFQEKTVVRGIARRSVPPRMPCKSETIRVVHVY